jgi:sortase (surface protein transpeptidase)
VTPPESDALPPPVPVPELGHRRRRGWVAVAVLLLVIAVGSLTVGLRGTNHALPPPKPSAAAIRSAAAAKQTPPMVATLAAARSVPSTLRIPAIGLSVPLSTLGLNADGSVQVPSNTVEPGWFQYGPTPGQVGSAVILGHVDSYQGPGVFFQLRTLASGDQVFVDLADGETVQFTVNAVAEYSKQQFPAQRVYGSHGSSALQLVTCGGTFDHQTGSYLSNIVVYTSLTAITPTAAAAAPSAQASS